jgi:dTDP-4-amino-4,6-dideoxygalactose transaminase
MKIPITNLFFGAEERQAVTEVLESGWVVQGPRVAEFERLFEAYTHCGHAVATTSATTALHLALIASGAGHGHEVIVPALTWVATANVAEMQHAKPVFVDIDLKTFNADASAFAAAMTSRTKAIIPVSLFGLSADMQPMVDLARRNSVTLIEDDACATGAWYHGRHAGTLADIGCFSFHPRKAITTGEGGMLVTEDAAVAAKVRSLRDHGASTSDLARHSGSRSFLLPEFHMVGYNYRMTDLQAAVGVAQMHRLEGLLAQRTAVARKYDAMLRDVEWLRPPLVPDGYVHGYQSYVCLYAPEEPTLANVEELHQRRNAFMAALESAGVATRPGTHAVHMLDYYRERYSLRPEDFPNAYIADRLSVTLPLYAQMTDEEQQYVVEQIQLADVRV